MAGRKGSDRIKPDTPVGEALPRILLPRVERVLSYEALVRARDVDGVHDMRVAAKRLREAARLFRPAFGRGRMACHTEGIEGLNDALGRTRELDVLAIHLRELAAWGDGLATGLQPLLDEVAAEADKAGQDLPPVLDRTLPALQEDFESLLRRPGKGRRAVWKMRMSSLGAEAVRMRLEAAFALEQAARDPEAIAELHRMRIAIKKVKYALEVFLPALGTRVRKAYAPISALQESIGEVHDSDVLIARITAARGGVVKATAARKALALATAERSGLYEATVQLLDELRAAGVSDRALKALR